MTVVLYSHLKKTNKFKLKPKHKLEICTIICLNIFYLASFDHFMYFMNYHKKTIKLLPFQLSRSNSSRTPVIIRL